MHNYAHIFMHSCFFVFIAHNRFMYVMRTVCLPNHARLVFVRPKSSRPKKSVLKQIMGLKLQTFQIWTCLSFQHVGAPEGHITYYVMKF